METIDFLDPDYKKKKKYNKHLKALTNFKDHLTPTDLSLISEFFERKLLNQRTLRFDNRVFLLNVAGTIRTLFRLFEFLKVEKDLADIGIFLSVPFEHQKRINVDFRRRNKTKRPFVKRPKQKVVVEYKRR